MIGFGLREGAVQMCGDCLKEVLPRDHELERLDDEGKP
jgi:hypothetical protein